MRSFLRKKGLYRPHMPLSLRAKPRVPMRWRRSENTACWLWTSGPWKIAEAKGARSLGVIISWNGHWVGHAASAEEAKLSIKKLPTDRTA